MERIGNYDRGPGIGELRDVRFRIRTRSDGDITDRIDTVIEIATQEVAREYISLLLHAIKDNVLDNLATARADTKTEPTPGGIGETFEEGQFAEISERGHIKINVEPKAPYARHYDTDEVMIIHAKRVKAMNFYWNRVGKDVWFKQVRKVGTSYLKHAIDASVGMSGFLLYTAIDNVERGITTPPPNGIRLPKRIRIYGTKQR